MLDPPPPAPVASPPESRLRRRAACSGDLARALEPALRHCCGGRLDSVAWFSSPWQAGGASTGQAAFTCEEDGRRRDVIVKIPVGPDEYRWTVGLGERDGCTPRVYAGGLTLGSYDLAWLVAEKLDGPALTSSWNETAARGLLDAVAAWYEASERRWPALASPRPVPDWSRWIDRAREAARTNAMPNAQRWNAVLKKLGKAAPSLARRWSERPVNAWCHGDLHPGNAMWRTSDNGVRRVALIDLALVHAGNWVEDAAYLEHLFWGRRHKLFGIEPVRHLAEARRERGLAVDPGDVSRADVKRAMLAAVSPLTLAQDGDPKYVAGALETLEELLPTLS